MEHQTIERLAMDAALGELNEDATALLNAYLAEHPDEQQWAQRMTAFCRRTKQALYKKSEQQASPVFTTAALRRQRAPIPWATAIRWAAVIVVSVVIGAGVGRSLRPAPTPPGRIVATETMERATPAGWQKFVGGSTGGFWQAKATSMLQSRPQRTPHPQPNFWQNLRQRQSGVGVRYE